MKKYLLLTLAWLTVSLAASAQGRIGLRAGLNAATVGGDSRGNVMRLGAHIGVIGKIKLAQYLYILPELQFSAQGTQSKEGTVKVNYNYFNIPLFLRIYPAGQGIYLEGGPQFGLLMTAKARTTFNGTMDLRSQLRSEDFAVGFGAGYRFTPHVEAGVRAMIGLSNTVLRPSPPGHYPNRVVQIALQINL